MYNFKTEVSNLNTAILGLVMCKDMHKKNILSLIRNDDRKFLLVLVFESFFERYKGEESLFFKNQKELTSKDIQFCIEVTKIINSYTINNEKGKKLLQETGIEVKPVGFREAVNYAFAKILEGSFESFEE